MRLTALLVLCAASSVALAQTTPHFTLPEDNPYTSTEGIVSLQWSGPDVSEVEGVQFELHQSKDAQFGEFEVRYQGPDRGKYLSGFPEGQYFFRVRRIDDPSNPGPWSETLEVEVKFVSMKAVVILMITGVIVLIATVTVILKGSKRTKIET